MTLDMLASTVPRFSPLALLVGALTLTVATGCPDESRPSDGGGSETAETGETETGDDTTTTTTTTDTDSSSEDTEGCTALGCECDNSPGSCDPGLTCVDGTCSEVLCGDGMVEGDEACDDGNDVDGDGCDNDCTPTQIAAVALGEDHSCALIDGGRLRCWGRGEFGQLGYGDVETIGDDEFPSDAGDVLLPAPVTKIAAGGFHTCALLQDGGLRCWGLNDRGQLGYGDLESRGDDETLAALAPVGVPPVIEARLGRRFTCARVGSGEVRCWGHNQHGQLGYGNTLDVPPVVELLAPGGAVSVGATTSTLDAGAFHVCAGFVDGGARCWGRNDVGQLGYGNLDAIGDNELPSAAGLAPLVPASLPANTEIVDLELGERHSCVLVGSGDVTCWGANEFGQLGRGNVDVLGDDETPDSLLPIELPGPAQALALGINHTCVLLASGEVMCWGINDAGQLGYGHGDTIGDDELPIDVGLVDLGGDAIAIDGGGNHTCALLENRDLVCWGQNTFSQLGIGSTVTVGDNESPADAGLVQVL